MTDDESGGTPQTGVLGTAPPPGSANVDEPQQLTATVRLFVSVLRKEITTSLRYGINFLFGQVSFFLVFALIVEGGRRIGGASFGDRLGGIVVGYLVFFIAQLSFTEVAGTVTKEAQWGTLERLYLSPLGFGRVMWVTALAGLLFASVQVGGQLLLALLFTDQSLVLDLVTIVPITALGAASVLGVGFATGGAAVLYKRLENASTVFSFAVIGLISAPVERLPWLRLFPIVQANDMLGRAMRAGVRLWEFSPRSIGFLTVVGIGYLIAGYVVFRFFVRRARIRGTLGEY